MTNKILMKLEILLIMYVDLYDRYKVTITILRSGFTEL